MRQISGFSDFTCGNTLISTMAISRTPARSVEKHFIKEYSCDSIVYLMERRSTPARFVG